MGGQTRPSRSQDRRDDGQLQLGVYVVACALQDSRMFLKSRWAAGGRDANASTCALTMRVPRSRSSIRPVALRSGLAVNAMSWVGKGTTDFGEFASLPMDLTRLTLFENCSGWATDGKTRGDVKCRC